MNYSPASSLRLVADVGGTNVRFALADVSDETPRLFAAKSFLVADFAGLEEAADRYLSEAPVPDVQRPRSAVVAVAGPITDGQATLTNGRWRMSEAALLAKGFSAARLINDYTALALSVRHLRGEDLAVIGPSDLSPPAGQTVAIVGAGTGLGVAAVVREGRREAIAATEGGHIGFAPGDETEIEILRLLSARFGRVSLERILSGAGLTDLYWALGRIDTGGDAAPLAPEEIVARAKAGSDPLAERTVDRFCAIYGAAAGDIALAFGARGGVYLGGGIAPRILDRLTQGDFRARFEAKGRFSAYLAAIPTQVIVHPFAALIGAAEALQPSQLAAAPVPAADL